MKEKIFEWSLHARTAGYRRRLDIARRVVSDALDLCSWVISWSGGKDSTALVHLVRSMAQDTPVMIQFDDCDWPEKDGYVNRVAAAHGWCFHRVEPDFSVWEAAKQCHIGHEDLCCRSHRLTRDGFLVPLADKRRELGCDGVFLGLRAEEGNNRRRNFAVRGHTYLLNDSTWRCCPLSEWIARDVFAYLVVNEVEINPCYFNNRFFQPEDIRLAWALPTPTGRTAGDMEHLRYYYPERFASLRDMEVV